MGHFENPPHLPSIDGIECLFEVDELVALHFLNDASQSQDLLHCRSLLPEAVLVV